MYVTAIFAAILALIFIRLSFNVIEPRHLLRVSLRRAIHAHRNFVEYVPMSLLLMGTLEFNGAPTLWVATLGVLLLLSRYFHSKGMNSGDSDFQNRVMGMKFTLFGLALLALSNVVWIAYVFIASAKFAAIH
jgi:uncharacterized protein